MWYPDFYKIDCIVLDAKYKWDDDGNDDDIRRADKHQIIAYMHTLHASTGGFIYPGKPDSPICSVPIELRGFGGKIYRLQLPIPRDAKTYEEFVKSMREDKESSEEKFLKEVRKLTNTQSV